MNRQRNTTRLATPLLAAVFLATACGGPAKDPQTGPSGGDAPPPPPVTDQPVKPKKKRKVSKEVKKEFKDAVKAYDEATKGGKKLDPGTCSDLAEKFAAVYEADPKLAEAKFNEGVVYEECGNDKQAEQVYQAVLRRHPNFGPALNNVGQIYFSRGNISTALQYFQKAAKEKNTEGYANLAVIERNQALEGNMQAVVDAVENVHRALAVDSFNIEAYGTLALVLYDHAKNPNQLEMARLICVQGIKVDESYAPLYNILGLILLRMGKVTPALAEFRKAVDRNPNYLEALMNIGAVTLSFRDYKAAEEAFSKALTLDPPKKTKVDALVGLGVAYRGQRKFDEAMAKYNEAKSLDPGRVSVDYNMGILVQDYRFNAGDPDEAVAQLKTAASYLEKYQSGGQDKEKLKDVKRRLKNINEMIPMLIEQKKMMEEMKKMQEEQAAAVAAQPAAAPAPEAAPAPQGGGGAAPAPAEGAAQPAPAAQPTPAGGAAK